jgi:molybdate transport system substrate-binding protein
MRNLAASTAARPIGCTQSTEIIGTSGVMLSGSLPRGCELSTVYTAAVAAQAIDTGHAQDLIDLLTGIEQRDLRQRAGFVEVRK